MEQVEINASYAWVKHKGKYIYIYMGVGVAEQAKTFAMGN